MPEVSYDIRKSSFKDFVWVNQGFLFENITDINLELYNHEIIDVQYFDLYGNLLLVDNLSGSGWKSSSPAGGPFPTGLTAKVKLVNDKGDGTTANIVGGVVTYNPPYSF
ncbi:TPA: hypothetical protein ACJHMI_005477 [Bacillus cereus]